jgi:iron(III) transport system substrate-binding protein
MANKAPHPNAAKLFIRWLLGDEQGGAGMKPWFVPGGWPSRTDVKPPIETTLDDLPQYTWFLEPDFIYDHGLEVRDFWLGL